MKFLLLFILIPFQTAFAIQKVEVWFLSRNEQAKLPWLPDSPKRVKNQFQLGSLVGFGFSEEEHRQCQAMGEGHFHPQIGLHWDGHGLSKEKKAMDPQRDPAKYFSATETDMISCDENYYFDIFCGKAKDKDILNQPGSVEIFLDVSGSFYTIDKGDSLKGTCYRRSFVESLRKKCSKVDFYVFTTSKKFMGSTQSACGIAGGNDTDKVLADALSSQAKTVIFITDQDENSVALREKLTKLNVTYIGDRKPMYAKDLMARVDQVAKYCQ